MHSELADEFNPSEQTVHNWIKHTDRDEGKRADGVTTDEREKFNHLCQKLRKLQQERDMLANKYPSGTAWFTRETGEVPPTSSDS